MERSHLASDDQVVFVLDRGEVHGEIPDARQSSIFASPVLADELVVEAEPRVLVALVGAVNALHQAAASSVYLGHADLQSAVVGSLLAGLANRDSVESRLQIEFLDYNASPSICEWVL